MNAAVRGRADPAGGGGRRRAGHSGSGGPVAVSARRGRARRAWPSLGGFALAGPVRAAQRGRLARGPGAGPAGRRAGRRPAVRAVPGAWRSARPCRSRSRSPAGRPGRTRPTRRGWLGAELRAGARRGRGDHDRAGRVHRAVRLGDADARVLPARRGRAEQAGPGRRGADHVRVRQGQRGGAAVGPAAARDQVALDPAGLVRPRARRRGPHHRRRCCCSAGSRSRPAWCRSRSGCRAGTRPRPARPARSWPASASTSAFYGMWRTLALLGRPPGWLAGGLLVLGALTALLGIAHAAVQNRLSRVIAYSSVENTGLIVTGFGVALTGAAVGDRRAGRGRAAGRHAAGGRAHRGQVAAVHLGRRDRGRGRRRRPGGAARRGRGGRRGAGSGLAVGSADAGRAAADGGVRVRVVPARVADAAVPGARRSATGWCWRWPAPRSR